MKFLEDTFSTTGSIHHAYVVTGDREQATLAIEKFLNETLAFSISNNPDFVKEQFDTLGIDDARKIKLVHSVRPFGDGDRRIFLILTNGFTIESQNAFLKVFEEPQPNNHFFIIIPSAHILLPTLRSRVIVIPFEGGLERSDADVLIQKEASTFIAAPIKERLKIVADIAGNISDEKRTKADAIRFLDLIEIELRKMKSPGEWTAGSMRAFEVILSAKDFLGDRSSSVKMLLEHVALNI